MPRPLIVGPWAYGTKGGGFPAETPNAQCRTIGSFSNALGNRVCPATANVYFRYSVPVAFPVTFATAPVVAFVAE